MKERTVSRRNFVGAFWGGTFGILAFGYLRPIALPFGCFLGVIIGWWYQEIWQSAFVFIPRWLLRKPTAFVQQLKAPSVQAYILRTVTIIIYLVLSALWVVPLVFYCIKAMEAAPKESAMPILYIFSIVFAFVLVLIPFIYVYDRPENMSKMQKFYLVQEQYATSNPFRFFTKNLANLFLYEISTLLAIGGMLIWFAGIGEIFLFFVIVPISVITGVVKGVYKVSTRGGHWLCFGTTVIVTAITAWVMYPYLNDTRILWTVALFAGLTSAVATEGLRRSLVWFFSISERTHTIASTTLGAQLASRNREFWRITTNIGNKFFGVLPRPV